MFFLDYLVFLVLMGVSEKDFGEFLIINFFKGFCKYRVVLELLLWKVYVFIFCLFLVEV